MPIIHEEEDDDDEDDDEVVFVKTIEANEANEAKPSRTGSFYEKLSALSEELGYAEWTSKDRRMFRTFKICTGVDSRGREGTKRFEPALYFLTDDAGKPPVLQQRSGAAQLIRKVLPHRHWHPPFFRVPTFLPPHPRPFFRVPTFLFLLSCYSCALVCRPTH
jgi:hypothetical protein